TSQLTANFNRVHNLVIDNQGMVWMGLAGGGLGRLNPQTGLMNQYGTWNSALVNNDVYSLTIAPNGKIWCGTFGGISVFDPQTGTFTTSYTMSNSQLPSDYVRAIDFDDFGYCWIGTGYGGVARLSPANTFTVWNENNSNLQSDSIWSVHVTNTSVWVATITEGVATFDLNIKNDVQDVADEAINFSVFPNPTTDFATLSFITDDASEVQVLIYNNVGQLVSSELWQTLPGDNRRNIDISGLSAGIYHIQLVGDGKSGTQKLIVE
ncbi:MAG: T9SS type A sorting domain-containing protein, partial [Bacteroidia bacterium]